MSRIAVISDIHSNRHALVAVMDRIAKSGCHQVCCLGDVVGYGAWPRECLQLVRDLASVTVQGNHDAMVAGGKDEEGFHTYAMEAISHNRRLLEEADLVWLGGLPHPVAHDIQTLLVHGSPEDRDRYLLLFSEVQEVAERLLETQGPGICFFGHTHQPAVYDGSQFVEDLTAIVATDSGVRMLVNPGSVGQPRDLDPRASFVIWDTEARTLQFQRVPYDVRAARRDVIAAGLPQYLGDRLLVGR